jgi:hypothetical protein
MRFGATPLLATSLLLSSCSAAREITKTVGEIQAVQQAVQQKLGKDIIGVTLMNGTSLNVNLVNSPLKTLPQTKKQAKAAEIARVAYDSYTNRSHLKNVRVTFAVVATTLVVVTTNDSSDTFTFDGSELANQSL